MRSRQRRTIDGGVKLKSAGILTKRQTEMMNLVKLGYANKQIARELGLAMGTVERCLNEVYLRLRADGRAHAVYLCMRKGIID